MYTSHRHHPNKDIVDQMTTLCTRALSSFNFISTSDGRYSDYKPDVLMNTAKTSPAAQSLPGSCQFSSSQNLKPSCHQQPDLYYIISD